MGKSMVRLAVVVAVAMGLVLGASAPSWAYFGIKGGMLMPNTDEKGLEGFDNGFGGEIAVGGKFGQGPVGFGLEGGVGGYQVKHENFDVKLLIVPVTLNGKLLIRPAETVTLFLGGGVGYYLGKVDGDGDEENGDGVGFQAVGGIEVLLGPVGLTAEVKWSQADVEFGDSDDTVNIGGTAILIGLVF